MRGVSARELDRAGITDPALRASYERCRELNASHGKTYYLATLLLPPEKRPYVHALYGFARYADEIVDDLASTLSEQETHEVGVDSDDELQSLMLVEQAYAANARVLSVIDELMKLLLEV